MPLAGASAPLSVPGLMTIANAEILSGIVILETLVPGAKTFHVSYNTTIDMNTGEHLWWVATGDTPARVRDHPALRDVALPESVGNGASTTMTTKTLVLYYSRGSGGEPRLYALAAGSNARTTLLRLEVGTPRVWLEGQAVTVAEGRLLAD